MMENPQENSTENQGTEVANGLEALVNDLNGLEGTDPTQEMHQEPPQNQPQIEPTKRGRGRPRKDGSSPSKTPNPKTPKADATKAPLDLLKDYENDLGKGNQGSGGSAQNNDPSGEQKAQHITGYLLLIMVDTIFPIGIFYATKRMGKKRTITSLRMTANERKGLIELADEAAKQMSVNMSPIALFAIVCTTIYASKLIDL